MHRCAVCAGTRTGAYSTCGALRLPLRQLIRPKRLRGALRGRRRLDIARLLVRARNAWIALFGLLS